MKPGSRGRAARNLSPQPPAARPVGLARATTTTRHAPGSRIHQGLVGARSLVGTRYLADPTLRLEYARDIAPRTTVAVAKVLAETFPDTRPCAGRARRVLDLGAGTGAAAAAVRAHFSGDLEVVAIDQVPLTPAVKTADVTDVAAISRLTAGGGPFDLVIAAHVLNELYLDQEPTERVANIAKLVGRWCGSLLAQGGTLIVIEPALRETSRVLLGVRDNLLASGLHIVAPCFFTGPCPALLRERDWCHDATPPVAASVGQKGGDVAAPATSVARRDSHRVDFSFLVVRASGEATTDSSLFRIVSDPLPEKGRLKLFACGLAGRHPVVRLDRHAAPPNKALDDLRRGDVVQISRTTFAQDGLRVGAETTVIRKTKG